VSRCPDGRHRSQRHFTEQEGRGGTPRQCLLVTRSRRHIWNTRAQNRCPKRSLPTAAGTATYATTAGAVGQQGRAAVEPDVTDEPDEAGLSIRVASLDRATRASHDRCGRHGSATLRTGGLRPTERRLALPGTHIGASYGGKMAAAVGVSDTRYQTCLRFSHCAGARVRALRQNAYPCWPRNRVSVGRVEP
jgi:hypothetical protein